MTEEYSQKLKDRLIFLGRDGLCIAFSGGVDSALLLKLVSECRIRSVAVTFDTFLHPSVDLKQAKELAEECGIPHYVIRIDEMENPLVMNNPPDRCYHCKHMLFEQLKKYAGQQRYGCVIDGTNADDLKTYRPGLRALEELNIKSPLAECGVSKAHVRELAKKLGVSVASRPSSPCLATRFPYGTHLTVSLLKKVEIAEEAIKRLGFYNVRVRCHQDIARIEVDCDDLQRLILIKDQVIQCCHNSGFRYVTLDLEGFRSGSMDLPILT